MAAYFQNFTIQNLIKNFVFFILRLVKVYPDIIAHKIFLNILCEKIFLGSDNSISNNGSNNNNKSNYLYLKRK